MMRVNLSGPHYQCLLKLPAVDYGKKFAIAR